MKRVGDSRMKRFYTMKHWLSFLLLSVFSSAAVAADEPLQELHEEIGAILGGIAVQDEGRIKPLDTYARSKLLLFQEKSTHEGASAMAWFAELLVNPEQAYQRKIFMVRTDEVVQSLHLEVNEDDHTYSFYEIGQGLNEAGDLLQKLSEKPAEIRTRAEKQIIELYYKVNDYLAISRSLSGLVSDVAITDAGFAEALGVEAGESITYFDVILKKDVIGEKLMAWSKMTPEEREASGTQNLTEFAVLLNTRMGDMAYESLRIIPPVEFADTGDWKAPWTLLDGAPLSDWNMSKLVQLKDVLKLATANDLEGLVTAVEKYKEGVVLDKSIGSELAYNKADFFYHSLYLYILSCLLLWFSFIGWSRILYLLSSVSFGIAVVLNVAGITMRCLIMGRPPITNLYESIIFVGAVICLSAIVLEYYWPRKISLFVGGLAGVILTWVGLRYASEGDTMGMLVAVLDSNFWLSTHVVTINLGYGAAFLSGLVAHIYLAMGCVGSRAKDNLKDVFSVSLSLSFVALFFTVIGTILGGIWADQSWGRFWGWDPKENGALLIALWLLIVLHGRLAGYLKPLEYAAGLALTNITVALAWFGVNLLQVGLHNYGFDDGVARGLYIYCGAEVLIVAVTYCVARYKLGPKKSSAAA